MNILKSVKKINKYIWLIIICVILLAILIYRLVINKKDIENFQNNDCELSGPIVLVGGRMNYGGVTKNKWGRTKSNNPDICDQDVANNISAQIDGTFQNGVTLKFSFIEESKLKYDDLVVVGLQVGNNKVQGTPATIGTIGSRVVIGIFGNDNINTSVFAHLKKYQDITSDDKVVKGFVNTNKDEINTNFGMTRYTEVIPNVRHFINRYERSPDVTSTNNFETESGVITFNGRGQKIVFDNLTEPSFTLSLDIKRQGDFYNKVEKSEIKGGWMESPGKLNNTNLQKCLYQCNRRDNCKGFKHRLDENRCFLYNINSNEKHPAIYSPNEPYTTYQKCGKDNTCNRILYKTKARAQGSSADGCNEPSEYPIPEDGIDAVFRDKSGTTYFFKGKHYYEYDDANRRVRRRGLIKDKWKTKDRGPIEDIDGIFYRPSKDRTYIFKGKDYWRYDGTNTTPKYKKTIKGNWKLKVLIGSDQKILGSIDAVSLVPGYDYIYIFKKNIYYAYRGDSLRDYGRKIAKGWDGIPEEGIDAVFTWSDGYTYFFKGNTYYKYKKNKNVVKEGKISDWNTGKCGVGEGDCDNDAQCQDGLKCGQRNGGETDVPGIKFDDDWTTGAYKDWDVCYDPTYGEESIESVQSIEYLARGYREDDSNLWSLYFVDTRLKFKNYETDGDSVVILPNFNKGERYRIYMSYHNSELKFLVKYVEQDNTEAITIPIGSIGLTSKIVIGYNNVREPDTKINKDFIGTIRDVNLFKYKSDQLDQIMTFKQAIEEQSIFSFISSQSPYNRVFLFVEGMNIISSCYLTANSEGKARFECGPRITQLGLQDSKCSTYNNSNNCERVGNCNWDVGLGLLGDSQKSACRLATDSPPLCSNYSSSKKICDTNTNNRCYYDTGSNVCRNLNDLPNCNTYLKEDDCNNVISIRERIRERNPNVQQCKYDYQEPNVRKCMNQDEVIPCGNYPTSDLCPTDRCFYDQNLDKAQAPSSARRCRSNTNKNEHLTNELCNLYSGDQGACENSHINFHMNSPKCKYENLGYTHKNERCVLASTHPECVKYTTESNSCPVNNQDRTIDNGTKCHIYNCTQSGINDHPYKDIDSDGNCCVPWNYPTMFGTERIIDRFQNTNYNQNNQNNQNYFIPILRVDRTQINRFGKGNAYLTIDLRKVLRDYDCVKNLGNDINNSDYSDCPRRQDLSVSTIKVHISTQSLPSESSVPDIIDLSTNNKATLLGQSFTIKINSSISCEQCPLVIKDLNPGTPDKLNSYLVQIIVNDTTNLEEREIKSNFALIEFNSEEMKTHKANSAGISNEEIRLINQEHNRIVANIKVNLTDLKRNLNP